MLPMEMSARFFFDETKRSAVSALEMFLVSVADMARKMR